MVCAISGVHHVYLPYAVSQIAQTASVQRSRIVEKPIEVDQLKRINEFIALQKAKKTTPNVDTTLQEPQDMSFGSVLSIYNQQTPAFNKDFFIAYNGINFNQK